MITPLLSGCAEGLLAIGGDRPETENFTIATFSDPDINTAGKLPLTVIIEGQGITSPKEGTSYFKPGATVNMTVYPFPYWEFDHWSGDVTVNEKDPSAPTTGFIMDRPRTVTAHFSEMNLELETWAKGKGTVTPGGSNFYEPRTVVTIKVTPAPNWQFDYWEGNFLIDDPTAETKNPELVLTMDRHKNAYANFSPLWTKKYRLLTGYPEPVLNLLHVTISEYIWRGYIGSPAPLLELLLQTMKKVNIEVASGDFPTVAFPPGQGLPTRDKILELRWRFNDTYTISQFIEPENRSVIKADSNGYRVLEKVNLAYFVMTNDTGQGMDGHIFIWSNDIEGKRDWHEFAIKLPGSDELDKSWIEEANKLLR